MEYLDEGEEGDHAGVVNGLGVVDIQVSGGTIELQRKLAVVGMQCAVHDCVIKSI